MHEEWNSLPTPATLLQERKLLQEGKFSSHSCDINIDSATLTLTILAGLLCVSKVRKCDNDCEEVEMMSVKCNFFKRLFPVMCCKVFGLEDKH